MVSPSELPPLELGRRRGSWQGRAACCLLLGGLLWTGCPRSSGAPEEGVAARDAVVVDLGRAHAAVESAAADLDVGIRGVALGALIRASPDPAGGSWGQRAMFDPSPWVQREGVTALGQRLPEAESAELLLSLAERDTADPYARTLAALTLADQGDRRAAPAMSRCMAVTESWKALPCALGAARLSDPAGEARLKEALAEQELPLDLRFVNALGDSGLAFLGPELAAAVGWVEEPLRVPVGVALFELDPALGAPVVRSFLAEPDLQVRLEVLDLLADSEQTEAEALLARAAAASDDAGTYARLIRVARGEGPLQDALDSLVDGDRETRALAAAALGQAWSREWSRKDRKAVGEALILAAADEEITVQLAVARALGASGDPAELELLYGFLDSEFPQLRLEAGTRLLQLAAQG